MKGVQARIPGTLPTPARARELFKDADAFWKSRVKDLGTYEEAVKQSKEILEELLAMDVVASDEYCAATEDAEPLLLKRYLGARAEVATARERLANARKSLREARKAEKLAAARREKHAQDFEAIQRGER
jgi:hypothetical protein